MKIGITIWGNRISPVFDASKTLLVVEIVDGKIVNHSIRRFHGSQFTLLQQLRQEKEIQLLICGAICNLGIRRLETMGVEVVPFIAGKVERILRKFVRSEGFTEFAMPGCIPGRRCRIWHESGDDTLQLFETESEK